MDPVVKHITVNRTARYLTFGNLHEGTRRIWLVCHGYGMLASFFIKKFEILDPDTHFVIAPEALSRSYLDGMSGRVGATWMTSEDREAEIADYVQYLDAVYTTEIAGKMPEKCQVTGLGFSQGCATISRWASKTRYRPDELVLWGGSPGTELLLAQSPLHQMKIKFVLGDEDEYFTEDVRRQFKEGMALAGFNWPILSYKGGHSLDSETIITLSTE